MKSTILMQQEATQTPGEERTLTSSKGVTVKTTLTDAEAIAACGKIENDDFAENLFVAGTSPRGLTPDMRVWAHIKAMKFLHPKVNVQPSVKVGSMKRVIQMFEKAATHLQHPKINLLDGPIELKIYPASLNSANKGFLYVKSRAGEYFGKISPAGEYFTKPNAPVSIQPFLTRFAKQPEKVAAEYGKLTGNCCFCHRPLSDKRSTDVGYGPVCADRFALKWGTC